MGQETNTKDLSTEDLLKMKKVRVKHMTDNMEALEIQDKFSNLKANIAENTLREQMSKMKLAQLMAKPESEPEKKEDESN